MFKNTAKIRPFVAAFAMFSAMFITFNGQIQAARPDFKNMPTKCQVRDLIFHEETGYDREMAIACGEHRDRRPQDRKRSEFARPPCLKNIPKDAKRPPFIPGTEKTDRGPED